MTADWWRDWWLPVLVVVVGGLLLAGLLVVFRLVSTVAAHFREPAENQPDNSLPGRMSRMEVRLSHHLDSEEEDVRRIDGRMDSMERKLDAVLLGHPEARR